MSTKKAVAVLLAAMVGLVLFSVLMAKADDTGAKLTDQQHMSLENAQLKLKLAYVALQAQQNDFQAKLETFNNVCEQVVKETKRPAGTRCNPETLEFVLPSAQAIKVPEKEKK